MTGEAAPGAPRWTRDYVFDILREVGIHHIFGVPGTNEIPIIDGTSYPENEVRYIECLHENIAIGAAMGHRRRSPARWIALHTSTRARRARSSTSAHGYILPGAALASRRSLWY